MTNTLSSRFESSFRSLAATALAFGAGFLLSLSPHSAQAADSLPMLLSAPVASDASRAATKAQPAERSVARQRAVSVNFEHLDPPVGNPPTALGVELFDGVIVTLDLDRIDKRGPGNYTWHGRVRGYDRSQAILTVVDGQIAGTITLVDSAVHASATYQIQSGPGGVQSLRQINPSGFPTDHPPGSESLRAPSEHTRSLSLTPKAGAVAAADAGTTIGVMIVYSNQTAAAAGTAIAAQLQQAIDSANTAYANSGISARLTLVHAEQVSYSESGDFNTDLNRLTSGNDGYMDNVQTLRNTYGADLVSLFIENGQYCGLAWIGPSASYAFSVVNRGCASGNLSFAHELGHNFGALHDTYVDASTSPYPYGHGYTDTTARWRTVMAYNNACAAAGVTCTRIPFFSNPNLTYGTPARPLGTTSTADNTRVHNQNAATVANFRSSGVVACTYTLSASSASVGAAAASGSVTVTAGTGCAWNTTSSAPSWLTIGAGSGTSASGTLNYAVAANTGPARSGTITVGGKPFAVSQENGCTYALNPTSANLAATGGSGSITVTTVAGCSWTASSSTASSSLKWLTVTSATSGAGSTTVSYSAAANTSTSVRSANLTIGGTTFMVTEAAAAPIVCSYALAPSNASVGAAAASGSVAVTAGAGCAWNAKSNAPSWLTIGAGSGTSASGTLNYAVAANTGSARTGTITVGGKSFSVSQEGCTYALNSPPVNLAATGGSGSVTLTTGAGCAWTATSSSPSWLAVTSAASGSGSTTVNYSVAPNTATSSRSASLTIGGVALPVTEAAAAPPAQVTPPAVASLSASSLAFGDQKIRTTSLPKTVTLTNGGGGALTISALTAGGANPTDFARSGSCAVNSALTAGQSCTIQYTFTPSVRTSRSAKLAVATSAGTVNLGLSGTGTRR